MDKKKKIYVTQPMLPDLNNVLPMLEDVWESKHVTNFGPYHNKLENELARLLKADNLSLFSNGTLGLLIALKALDLEGEVIVTPFTFPATITCIEWAGLTPVFCDIDEKTLCLNPDLIEELITDKTCAILGVHVYGIICDVERISEIANKHNIKVIYDGAHAFMSTYKGQPVSDYGDATMFSLHATKLFNSIEGGAVSFKSPEVKTTADLMKNFGINAGVPEITGINAKMNEISSAIGLANLNILKQEREKREYIKNTYDSLFAHIKGVKTYSHILSDSLQYYPISIDASLFGLSRDKLMTEMGKHNIFPRKYFYPACHRYPYLKNRKDIIRMDLPIVEKVEQNILCLPFYGGLIENGLDRVVEFFSNRG